MLIKILFFAIVEVMNTVVASGLTTGKADFIEEARDRKEMFIHQPYELYSEENHAAWRMLCERIYERWEKYANPVFLKGVELLHIDKNHVPRLSDINKFLKPLTGFQARPVSGYVPAGVFFDCLKRREFPTTITIRDSSRLDYLPEPDIFHDVGGHVPMHTNKEFADVLARFGQCAQTAAELGASIQDVQKQKERLGNIIKAMARFFWFTVEFGLIRDGKDTKAYGSGLLSSYGELEHCIIAPEVQRFPAQMEWMINQYFEIDRYQPLLFIIDSFEHLFSLVDQLESWMKNGKLSNVAPGKPDISDMDLKSFLDAIQEK